jgi:hypothetical protein
MMAFSHTAMTSSSFLIVFAAVERYCITLNNEYVKFLQNHRIWIAFTAVLIGIVSKGTILFELDVRNIGYNEIMKFGDFLEI